MDGRFHIRYKNAHHSVLQPESYEGYDVVSAHYDYLDAGPSATIVIDDYSLDLDGRVFINWIRESLGLAEAIATNAPDYWPPIRESLPALPADAHVQFWIAADIPTDPPVLVFVVDGERVLIYTRSSASISGPTLVRLERDREAPSIVARSAAVATIAECTTRYLDDLVAAFPFLQDDPVYQSQRQRLFALAK